MLVVLFLLSAKLYTSYYCMYMRVGKNILQRSSFRESMKLSCKGNCCVFHLYKVFRWYGLTISTPFGLYSEP